VSRDYPLLIKKFLETHYNFKLIQMCSAIGAGDAAGDFWEKFTQIWAIFGQK